MHGYIWLCNGTFIRFLRYFLLALIPLCFSFHTLLLHLAGRRRRGFGGEEESWIGVVCSMDSFPRSFISFISCSSTNRRYIQSRHHSWHFGRLEEIFTF